MRLIYHPDAEAELIDSAELGSWSDAFPSHRDFLDLADDSGRILVR